MLELELTISYNDEKTAKAVFGALEPDNEGYVESKIEGNTLRFLIKSKDAGSMKNTADDLLACVKIAEDASGLVVPAADPDGDSLSE
jgi:tRNA threonylcarbamoyladenosine modification (KEOPS) complex  Pcc1 subunit